MSDERSALQPDRWLVTGGSLYSWYAQTDIFRLQHALIVEHWANSEVVLPEEQWVNSGPF